MTFYERECMLLITKDFTASHNRCSRGILSILCAFSLVHRSPTNTKGGIICGSGATASPMMAHVHACFTGVAIPIPYIQNEPYNHKLLPLIFLAISSTWNANSTT